MADKILSIADGLHDELPSTTTAKAGRILITTDRGEMYYEPEDKKRIQVNPQSDWQQNDETANDYVKNRPGGYDALTELLPETTLNFASNSLTLTNCPPIEVGKKYIVTFDGTEYELVGKLGNTNFACIGNESFTWGSIDTGEPFLIFGNGVSSIYISSSETLPCTHNIKIKAITPIKINEKYLDSKNANIVNGSATGSLRTVGSTEENSSYTMGMYAFAEGISTTASRPASHAEGSNTKALSPASHAEGGYTTASGNNSHAEGGNTTASGNNSHAEGNYTTASGDRSHAEGSNTKASGNYQHVQGKYNIADTANNYADIIGNGSSNTKRSNAATVDWQGNAWYAGDVYVGSTSGTNKDEGSKKLATEEYVNSTISSSIVVDSELSDTSTNPVQNKVVNTALSNKMDKTNPTGAGSFSLNRKADTIVGDYSFTEGYNTTASGYASHAEGYGTKALESRSHAEGDTTTASGTNSHAEGIYTTASGTNSHAEGSYTTASGSYSHAEGNRTTASGSNSHAEGDSTTASGYASHAEGSSTNLFSSVVTATNPTNDDIITAWNRKKFSLAKGISAHVEGNNNLALGNYSHAEGDTTTASSNYQHVQGKYNIEDSNNTYADIIGNGKSDTNRSNAATVDWQGNAWYAGDVYVGSTSGTNKDEGSKKLATEEYIDTQIGDINTTLDSIIEMQNSLIGGN